MYKIKDHVQRRPEERKDPASRRHAKVNDNGAVSGAIYDDSV